MKKYKKYKDSKIDWIAEIPEHWEMVPNKYIFNLKQKLVGKKSDEYDLLSLTLRGIIKRDMENPEGKFPTSFEKYQEVEKNDFVFCLFDVEETPRTVGLSPFNGMITGAYTVFDVNKNYSNKFLYYFYLNLDNDKRLRFLYRGLRNTIPKESFNAFKTIIPPLPEQTAIANFLNEKTSKIDEAVQIKEREIELLKKRRQIIIQDVVTGKKVYDEKQDAWVKPQKTKDSGVEWIGEIPEDWEVRKLFDLCKFIRGNSTFGKDELRNEGEYVALQYGKSYKVTIIDETYNFYVNNNFYKESQVVNFGDTIIISTSETIEDLGHSAFYQRNDLGLLGGEQIMIKPQNEVVNDKFIYFSSRIFSKELRKFATGIKVFRFNINDLKTIYIPMPSFNEQINIVSYIDSQSTKITHSISLKEQEIEKLKEYKTVLIDSAVTGKIRVEM